MKTDANDILHAFGPDVLRQKLDHSSVINVNGVDNHNEHLPLPEPLLNIINPVDWNDQMPPPRKWLVPGRIPARQVSLLSGDGSVGKSLLSLQLAIAVALGTEWCGGQPDQGRVIYFSAEDEADEHQRRTMDILRYYGASTSQLSSFTLMAQAGRETVLAAPDHHGIIKPTDLFQELMREAIGFRPILIVIDNSADAYGGDEIKRAQVRQFINRLLLRLAMSADAAVLLLGHPSLSGLASGSGLSGSTAWHNSVRSRLVLEQPPEPKNSDEAKPDPYVRVLKGKKSNYSAVASDLMLRWTDGVLVPAGSAEANAGAMAHAVRETFMKLLRLFTENKQTVSASRGPTYAPALFAEHASAAAVGLARKEGSRALARAMQELLDDKEIVIEEFGPPSHRRSRLRVAP